MKQWLALATVILAGITGCGEKSEKAEITDIKELVESRCSACHFSDKIFNPQPAEKWPPLVERMHALNPEMMSEEESGRITEYLVKNYSLK